MIGRAETFFNVLPVLKFFMRINSRHKISTIANRTIKNILRVLAIFYFNIKEKPLSSAIVYYTRWTYNILMVELLEQTVESKKLAEAVEAEE